MSTFLLLAAPLPLYSWTWDVSELASCLQLQPLLLHCQINIKPFCLSSTLLNSASCSAQETWGYETCLRHVWLSKSSATLSLEENWGKILIIYQNFILLQNVFRFVFSFAFWQFNLAKSRTGRDQKPLMSTNLAALIWLSFSGLFLFLCCSSFWSFFTAT